MQFQTPPPIVERAGRAKSQEVEEKASSSRPRRVQNLSDGVEETDLLVVYPVNSLPRLANCLCQECFLAFGELGAKSSFQLATKVGGWFLPSRKSR